MNIFFTRNLNKNYFVSEEIEMLQISKIKKQYITGKLTQTALDEVSLNFRDNEFVAILGPSGSGKTTLLNIIGGLDRYDSGDLIINGISTKKYKDRDWDSYRNHTIGFVFQSYNLIPHQSVLANVELALTISGISKSERRRRAKEALEKVGLGNQLHKRPNQMSGGQMQRVAIARALVNDPDILLADEPTGALDSDTSIQVMDILAEVAKDRLVIMVTHNPELAEEYATRIVKLRDGKMIDDSNPYEVKSEETKEPKHKNMGKASMSFLTALSLSFNNLRTKKGRTILTAFAGSIGIIGIALILSLSNGVNNYIDNIQKNTMSSYPISIDAQSIDLTSLMDLRPKEREEANDVSHEMDGVYVDGSDLERVASMTTSIKENNLTKFKQYLDDEDSEIHKYIGENGIVYSYDTKFGVYTYDENGTFVNTDGSTLEDSKGQSGKSGMMSAGMGMIGGTSSDFSELMPGIGGNMISTAITDNYDVVYGKMPDNYDEIVLVLDKNNELSATTLYELGILPTEEYREIMEKISDKEEIKIENKKLNYEDICSKDYYLIPACDYFVKNENGTYDDVSGDNVKIRSMLESAMKLKITGIIKPNEDCETELISSSVGYTKSLTDYLIDYTNNSEVVKAQTENPDINVLNGMKFATDDDSVKISDAKIYIANLDEIEKAEIFRDIMQSMMEGSEISDMVPQTEENGDGTVSQAEAQSDVADMQQPTGQDGINLMQQMEMQDDAVLAAQFDEYMKESDDDVLLSIYNTYISTGNYDDNLSTMGVVSVDAPSSIDIYADNFEDKDAISNCIKEYNKNVDEADQITYTDYVGLIMSSVTTIVNVISYVLIAFVAVSLVVSSIMIGIITYISVLERTKEIGILRAIGASKKNISQVFNAETFIIGLLAGIIGIVITLLLLLPVNAIIHSVTGTDSVNAALPVISAIVLIVLSTILTLIGGFIPAKKAAKKDPVTALRTE